MLSSAKQAVDAEEGASKRVREPYVADIADVVRDGQVAHADVDIRANTMIVYMRQKRDDRREESVRVRRGTKVRWKRASV